MKTTDPEDAVRELFDHVVPGIARLATDRIEQHLHDWSSDTSLKPVFGTRAELEAIVLPYLESYITEPRFEGFHIATNPRWECAIVHVLYGGRCGLLLVWRGADTFAVMATGNFPPDKPASAAVRAISEPPTVSHGEFEVCPNCGQTVSSFGAQYDLNVYRCSCGKVYCDNCTPGGCIDLPRCPVSPYHEGMTKVGIVPKHADNPPVKTAGSTFKFACPECAGHLEAEEEWQGLQVNCPHCGQTITIPSFTVARPLPAAARRAPRWSWAALTVALAVVVTGVLALGWHWRKSSRPGPSDNPEPGGPSGVSATMATPTAVQTSPPVSPVRQTTDPGPSKALPGWTVTDAKVEAVEGAYTTGEFQYAVTIEPLANSRVVKAGGRLRATTPETNAIEKYVRENPDLPADKRAQLKGQYRLFDMKGLRLAGKAAASYRAVYVTKPKADTEIRVGVGGRGVLVAGLGGTLGWHDSRSAIFAVGATIGTNQVPVGPEANSYVALVEVGSPPVELEAVFLIPKDTDLKELRIVVDDSERGQGKAAGEQERQTTPGASSTPPAGDRASTRHSQVTSICTWTCPKCGTMLEKGNLGKVWHPGDPVESVGGTATCGKCQSTYPQADVYGGKYDTRENARTSAKPPGFRGRVSVVIFRHVSSAPPPNPTALSAAILRSRYPNAVLGKNYVIGLPEAITLDEAKAQYRANVNEGKLPDLGSQFDAWTGKDITGKSVTVLVFESNITPESAPNPAAAAPPADASPRVFRNAGAAQAVVLSFDKTFL